MKITNFLIVSLLTSATIFSATRQASAEARSSMRVEGATEAQLLKIRTAIENAAYGDGARKEKISAADARVSDIAESDACPTYYSPPAKFRILKKLPMTDLCVGRATSVVADTDSQIIFLCKDGKSVGDYDFAKGFFGVGKRTKGDRKTPLGVYPILGRPFKNANFGTFIHLGYPTPSQIKKGFTGSEVGIHGPARPFRCAGFLNTSVNWTRGCLAVASDIEIKEIARFIQVNSIKQVTILPFEETNETTP